MVLEKCFWAGFLEKVLEIFVTKRVGTLSSGAAL